MAFDEEQLQQVTPEEASESVAEGAVLLDVREPFEWEAGHIEGAVHIPLADLQGALGDLSADKSYVVVCRSGQRSARATSLLLQAGLSAVNLDGGVRAWDAAGLPLCSDAGSAGTVV